MITPQICPHGMLLLNLGYKQVWVACNGKTHVTDFLNIRQTVQKLNGETYSMVFYLS